MSTTEVIAENFQLGGCNDPNNLLKPIKLECFVDFGDPNMFHTIKYGTLGHAKTRFRQNTFQFKFSEIFKIC